MSAMDILLRAAAQRLLSAAPPCCEPESLAAETGIDPEVACSLLPDSEAVLKTLAESALRRQMDHLTRRLGAASSGTPAEQLVALGNAFVEWATENRNDFRILNSPLINVVVDGEEIQRYHHALQQVTVSMLKRARDEGQLRPDLDPVLLSLVARAFTYGLARLCVDGQLDLWQSSEAYEDERARLTTAVAAFAELMLTGWQPTQPIRSEA